MSPSQVYGLFCTNNGWRFWNHFQSWQLQHFLWRELLQLKRLGCSQLQQRGARVDEPSLKQECHSLFVALQLQSSTAPGSHRQPVQITALVSYADGKMPCFTSRQPHTVPAMAPSQLATLTHIPISVRHWKRCSAALPESDGGPRAGTKGIIGPLPSAGI